MPAQAFPPLPRRRNLGQLVISVILVSIGIHVAAGLIAGAVIIARYLSEPPAEFRVVKDVRIPAKKREHAMNMSAFEGMASQPAFNDSLQSIRPGAFALPDLPEMDTGRIALPDASEMVSADLAGLAGSAAAGAGEGLGGLPESPAASFFGIESSGQRILLLFDVSSSVVNKAESAGIPLSKIREETASMIRTLPVTARFGMIQFTQNFKPFRRELIPATDQNRAEALEWIEKEWVETGSMGASRKVVSNTKGFAGVLELAASMHPDVIFVITDASFQWKPDGQIENIPWKEIRRIAEGPLQSQDGCRIHLIGFQIKPADRREAGAMVKKSGGSLREIN